MTDSERLDTVEARLELIAREHKSLLESYGAVLAANEKLRRDLDADYMLLGQAVDARIGEVIKARAGGADNSDEVIDLAAQWFHVTDARLSTHNEQIMRLFGLIQDLASAVNRLAGQVAQLIDRAGRAA